ncbi:MAG: AraC family transcriptional regulator [Polyangiales bacterium]
MLSHHPTVPFSMLRGLFGVVERKGVSRSKLMEAAGIRPEELERPELRLGRDRFEHAAGLAIALTGDEALGLHWAELMMERGFGPIADGLAHASSLRQAFLLLERFEKFFTNRASLQVEELDGEARVRMPSGFGQPIAVRRFLAELSVAWYVSLIRAVAPDAPVTRVAFAYDAPRYQDAYAALFGVVHFGQACTEVGFPRGWLDAPRRQAEAHEGSSVGTRTGQRPGCADHLYWLLRERATERLSMPDAARALGFEERSLRRRLTAEGHSFKEIEFRAYAEVARELLADGRRTIRDTASEMGFSGAHAFQRAFKRWTGESPRSYRVGVVAAVPRALQGREHDAMPRSAAGSRSPFSG